MIVTWVGILWNLKIENKSTIMEHNSKFDGMSPEEIWWNSGDLITEERVKTNQKFFMKTWMGYAIEQWKLFERMSVSDIAEQHPDKKVVKLAKSYLEIWNSSNTELMDEVKEFIGKYDVSEKI